MGKFLRGLGQTLVATLVLLLLLELGCRVAGLATGANSYVEGILIRNQVTLRKPAGEFRIFTYGESTMHGSHYWPASNPSRWLEAYLQDFLPHKKIRVINFSRMGQGSDFVLRSFQNTLIYKPDLVIFYMGHNFFLPGNRVDQVERKENKLSFHFKLWIRQSVLISSVIRQGIRMKNDRKMAAEEDQVGSLKIEVGPSGLGPENQVVHGSDYFKATLNHHLENVDTIQTVANQKKIPIIFFKPVANLKDFPPSCSTHRRTLSAEKEAEWKKFYEEGQKAQASGDMSAALQAYQSAYELEPTYADLLYRLGQLYFKSGELEKARAFFEEAKNEDCLIVRAPKEVQEVFDGFREKRQAIVLDTEKFLLSEAPGGILGDPIVEDNVHFSVKGHAILGRALAQEIANHGWIAPKSEWRFDQEKSFEAIASQLGVTEELIFSAFLKCASYFGSKFEERILYAQKALAIHPENPQALRQLAWSYWLKGDRPKAIEVYKKLSSIAPEELEQAFQNQPALREAFTQTPTP